MNFMQILICLDTHPSLIVLAAGLAYYLQALTENKFKARFTEDLRNALYSGIMRKGAADFQARDTAEYLSIISNDVDTLTTNFSSPIWALAGAGISVIFSLAVMMVYSPLLAGVAVLCSLLSFIAPKLLTEHIKKRLVEKTKCEASLSVQLKEALNGHDVVSAFGILPRIYVRFSEANKSASDSFYRFSLLLSALQSSSLVMGKAIKVVTFLIAGGMAVRGLISVGTVLLFVSLYSFFSGGCHAFLPVRPPAQEQQTHNRKARQYHRR